MPKKNAVALYRIVFAILVIAAVIVQPLHTLKITGNFNAFNYFSFFTIESNILGAVVLLIACLVNSNKRLDVVRGAATLYMTVTGIVYTLLLSRADVQTPIPWVNAVLHYIFPLVMLFDWLLNPPNKAIRYKTALLWLIFPVVYLGYSLIRGHITHWYPYPFLNVMSHGYVAVAINSLVIAVAVVALGWLLTRAKGK